ncbi:AfsR/SARP family transcriptional regulator [Solwaraspora sp. WMMA2101]|uniref:AfsR/SARP family transcriptional regulator n=1 Tax=Solwaraspora sp. WMMA2101 TaxID=3404124 RepID=UPI003B93D4DD
MKWKLLGPVEVHRVDRQVRRLRPRQRAVLAYLLLNANRVVPTGHLIDAVWAHTPPRSARLQVQACVSALRQAIAINPADGPLVSEAGGYRMVVANGELDHEDFVQRVSHARSSQHAGRSEEAADQLRSALVLWRGAPLSGANGAFVAAASAALEQQRLAAIEDLAVGSGARVGSESRPPECAAPGHPRKAASRQRAIVARADRWLANLELIVGRGRRRHPLPAGPPLSAVGLLKLA